MDDKEPNADFNKETPLPKGELELIIQRIYEDELTAELFDSPGEIYRLIQLLCPECPTKAIQNAKKNHSTKKADNILYHLVKLTPRLFFAALHYTDYELTGQECKITSKCGPKKARTNRFNRLVKRNLEYIEELEDELERIKEANGYMLEAEHLSAVKALKQERDEEVSGLEDRIKYLEGRAEFRDQKLQHHNTIVEKENEYLKDQIARMSSDQ